MDAGTRLPPPRFSAAMALQTAVVATVAPRTRRQVKGFGATFGQPGRRSSERRGTETAQQHSPSASQEVRLSPWDRVGIEVWLMLAGLP